MRMGALVAMVMLAAGCGADAYRLTDADANALAGGDPDRGRERIREYGCTGCHTVRGVSGAHGRVGPPLAGLASRIYIAGALPNSPANLVRWIEDPTVVDPKTAMPDLDVTPSDARDIAAYLYTLR